MLTVPALVALGVSSCFSPCLISVGAQLGISAVIWDVLAMGGLMLPVICAVLVLLRKAPAGDGLHELVASQLGDGFGGIIVVAEWVAAVGSIVTQLQFCIAAGAYPVDKVIDDNQIFLAIGVSVACLLATAILALGVERAVNIIALCCLMGSGVPIVLLAVGAGTHSSELTWSIGELSPTATGVLFGFAGLEISAFHLRELPAESRQKKFKQALTWSMLILVLLYSVSHVLTAGISDGHVDLTLGFLEALSVAVETFPPFVFYIACWLVAVGQFSTTIPLMLGPLRGMAELLAHIPRTARLRPAREHGIALWLITAQTVFLVCLALLFLCTPAAGAFWLLTAVAGQATQVAYLVIYGAAFVALRGQNSRCERALLLAGTVTSLLGLGYGFAPPADETMSTTVFISALGVCDVMLLVAAYLLGTAASKGPSKEPAMSCALHTEAPPEARA